ncbi:sensor histidine kinase [Ferruginivarius sediminum]|nr:ATP-binding protein [Ferruginivarius sediminum]
MPKLTRNAFARLVEPLRCRLCRRIAGVVFLSILVVEGAILVPSYFSYRADLHDRLAHAGRAALSATFRPQTHARTSDLLIAGRLISQDGSVLGGRLYDADGKILGAFSEAPEYGRAALVKAPRRTAGGDRYEVFYSADELGTRYGVAARLDATWIAAELNGFVWRILTLVLMISTVVCAATMIIVGRKAMAPMLALRDHLAAAHDDPAHADQRKFRGGGDEWNDLGEAVDRLFGRVARTYREDLMLMTTMADQASDAIIAYDQAGNIVYANAACRELAGCDNLEQMQAAGRPRVRMPGEEVGRPLPEAIHDRVNGVQVIVEGCSGREVPCLMQAAFLDSAAGGQIHCYGHLTDISQLRDAQERLMQQNMELEAANRAKSEFLANVSHELRTPLNAIIGFSELLRNQAFPHEADARYREYADDIQMSGRHLLSLINDILDLSKIEAGHFELQEIAVDTGALVDSALRLVRGRREAQSLKLSAEIAPDLPQLFADDRAVKQVLINLLSNAVKFTPEEGSVAVRASQRADGGIDLAVADTGIGMDPKLVSRAFQPFAQVDVNFQRRFEGTGLGLSLVASLSRMHGAEVGVDTCPGQGTTVTLHFPPKRTILPEIAEEQADETEGEQTLRANVAS